MSPALAVVQTEGARHVRCQQSTRHAGNHGRHRWNVCSSHG
ncbi:hypothetical protein NP493_45g00018 [Ridgeia piscesae]|uniref:Uncharacterized protein n=1 Tax=Ridgeia piscesae TaxID=27915 RepID=A0AAD9UJM4_RIDPI|nr:hypothetical protein NP493_45g00018 [Ridgeia piscesae]